MFLLSKNIANVDVYLQYEFFCMGNNYPTKKFIIIHRTKYLSSFSKQIKNQYCSYQLYNMFFYSVVVLKIILHYFFNLC